MIMDMEKEWLWLSMIPGLYRSDKKKLLEEFMDPYAMRMASEKEIKKLSFLKEKQKTAILTFQEKEPDEFLPILWEKDILFYSCEHERYPDRLKEIVDYPYGLFVRGNLPDPGTKCIAVVGARTCTNYGRKMAETIAGELARKNVAVVSGMAMGIDGIAQTACLENNMKSVAVVGSGCDVCYPRSHIELYQALRKNGAIISEFPPGTIPFSSHFPQRNRIISGMCDAVIVIEAKEKSGSLITADMALDQGRDVYAVPGRIGDPLSVGCNQLIFQGAGIINDMKVLMESLGLETKKEKKEKKKNNNLEICENMVYICLDFHGKSLEDIAECTKYSTGEILTALLQLQVKGLAVEISKNRYALK